MHNTNKEREFLDFIEEETQKYWDNNKEILLLSQLVPLFKKNKGEFNLNVITDKKLNEFIKDKIDNDELSVKIIRDKNVKARIGILPKDESKNFGNYSNKQASQKIILDFLDLLSFL